MLSLTMPRLRSNMSLPSLSGEPRYTQVDSEELEHGKTSTPKSGCTRGFMSHARKWTGCMMRRNFSTVVLPADNESVVDANELHRCPTSIDNLSILSQSQLPQGKISFWKEFTYEEVGRPYCIVKTDTPIEEIEHLMGHDWKLTLPTIVLVVISSLRGSQDWKGHKQWSLLQKGLIEAANTTNMWILTHGMNTGVPSMIGNIIRKEEQRRQAMKCHRHPKQTGPKFPDLHLMGIVNSELTACEHLLQGSSRVQIQNKGLDDKFELNADHSHFFLIKDRTKDSSGINRFVVGLEKLLKTSDSADNVDSIIDRTQLGKFENPTIGGTDIPVISLMIGGGHGCTTMVLEQLRNEIPVVVIKGSGGAANLLAFAHEEIKEKSRGDWDPDYVENFIKSELSRKIASSFPKYRDNNLQRNKFRDKILECIRHSNNGSRAFLSFLDIHNHTVNLAELNQHLLRALFKATVRTEESSHNWYEHLQKDLYLTLDWNSPHIALSEVFQKNSSSAFKYKVDKKIFEAALLRSNREEFISLFLDQGFQVHKFLNEKRFKRLFEKAECPEFFRTVCLEGMLGYSFSLKLGKDFVRSDFNWMIKHLTKLRNFVDVEDLNNNALGLYSVMEPRIAERRAQTLLALWAVLMNRPKLAKVLWRRADYPIHLALVVGLMYAKLVAYVRETHLINEMEERSKEFADMAVSVLDMSFLQNNCRAFDILSEQISDWNFKTAVEIAADARNRPFIAHPCCQKWLTNMFFGDIRIRELKWGTVTIPVWIKVILSAFFIFPMYIWVHFKTGQKRSIMGIFDDGDSEECSDDDSDCDTISQPPLSRMTSREQRQSIPMSAMNNRNKDFEPYAWSKLDATDNPTLKKSKARTFDWTMLPTPVTFLQYFQPKPQPPFWKKIYIMWNAPVTKFWTYQIFYILYLGLFSIAVLQPGCGLVWLDLAVWIWTALILMENVRKAYIQFRDYSSVPLLASLIEIILLFTFLMLYMIVRILPNTDIEMIFHITFISPYMARVVLCIGLLYVYYRFIWIYLPISPTLGPLLFRIKLMVTVDFIHFLRLTLLFIISGGIVIHSVIYPDYPMNTELLRRVFHRAWFTLFITPFTDELEGNHAQCLNKTMRPELLQSCPSDLSKWSGEDGIRPESICPKTGFWPYLMVIVYLVILKLILLTLLYALFSNTAQRAAQDTDAIWKFQRYHLVLDFNTRYRLPAPLNAISFLISIVDRVCAVFMCRYCRKRDEPDKAEELRLLRLKQNDHNYWRALAEQFSDQEKARQEEKNLPAKQMECMWTMMHDIEHHKWMLNQMKVRFAELEKIMLTSKIALEEIRNEISEEETKVINATIHSLSRHSPYPGTRVKRFPLADRYVPWEVLFSIYDPVMYSKPRTEFRQQERECVDEDLLSLKEGQVAPTLKWNFAYTSGAGITTDRCTWLLDENGQPLIYKLDSANLPMNPMGRTGLRGRGSLHRWGPNHCIYLVVTRWRQAEGFLQSVTPQEDHKELELISMMDRGVSHLLTLPGGFIMNYDTVYEVIKKQFSTEPTSGKWTAEAMQQYFAQYARAPAGDFVDIVGEDAEQTNFTSAMVMRGYLDDNQNTDNAWIEAEIWHFHYTSSQSFDSNLPFQARWKKITSNLSAKMKPSHAAIVLEVIQRLDATIVI